MTVTVNFKISQFFPKSGCFGHHQAHHSSNSKAETEIGSMFAIIVLRLRFFAKVAKS